MTVTTRPHRDQGSHVGVFVRLGLVFLAVACGGGADPNVGDGAPGTFSEIYATVLSTETDSRCNFCHSMPASQVSNGNFHTGMDAAQTYDALLGTTSTSNACAGRSVVVPGDPEQSLFYLKVAGQPPCGNRMPLGGRALSAAQVEMVRSWIAAGANDD
jgi:hypothetical protein